MYFEWSKISMQKLHCKREKYEFFSTLYCVHNIIFRPFQNVNSQKEATVSFHKHKDKMML